MLFSIGTRVAFLNHAEEGVITRLLGNGMVEVRLADSDMEIPAFVEDLVRLSGPATPGARFISAQNNDKRPHKNQTENPDHEPKPATQYHILNGKGLQVAFVPSPEFDAFDAHLLNDTPFDFAFRFFLTASGRDHLENEGKIPKHHAEALGSMPKDLLNERPEIHLSVHRLSTAGIGPLVAKPRKLRGKSFFRKPRISPLLNQKAFVFTLLDQKDLEEKRSVSEDLRDYTRRVVKEHPRKRPQPASWGDPLKAASFPLTLDLHAEVALPDLAERNANEIFPAQMRLFERYMAEAIHHACFKVTLIHGKGEGKLRQAIAHRLASMAEVNSFRHSHDMGATEVFLDTA